VKYWCELEYAWLFAKLNATSMNAWRRREAWAFRLHLHEARERQRRDNQR
jgi:hypothetical protein